MTASVKGFGCRPIVTYPVLRAGLRNPSRKLRTATAPRRFVRDRQAAVENTRHQNPSTNLLIERCVAEQGIVAERGRGAHSLSLTAAAAQSDELLRTGRARSVLRFAVARIFH